MTLEIQILILVSLVSSQMATGASLVTQIFFYEFSLGSFTAKRITENAIHTN
jgi:hypothetical protein